MMKLVSVSIVLAGVILGVAQTVYSAECASNWLFYKSPSEVYGPYGYCDTTAVESSPGNNWCATQTIPVYYAQKGFGTDWTADCSKCVQGPWYYAHQGGISGPYNGCTYEGADYDANGQLIGWCATATAPTYVTQHGFETNWEGCTPDPCDGFVAPSESLGQCKKWVCDPQTGNAITVGIGEGEACDDGNACTTGETCSWGSCQNGTYCTVETTGKYCDPYLHSCITPSAPNCNDITIKDAQYYTVKPCDRIVKEGTALTVKEIIPPTNANSYYGKLGIIVFALQHTNNAGASKIVNTGARLDFNGNSLSNFNGFGAYLSMDSSKFSTFDPQTNPFHKDGTATIKLFTSCTSFYQDCLKQALNLGLCYSACEPTPTIPHLSFASTKDVRVSMPAGYSKAAQVVAQISQNCYNKITNLFGMTSGFPMNIVYQPINDTGSSKCTIGFGYNNTNVRCVVSPEFADDKIEGHPHYATMLKKAADGVCLEIDKNPLGDIAHELGHHFASLNFEGMNSEGLADFVRYEIREIAFNSDKEKLFCLDSKWKIEPDGPYNSGNYNFIPEFGNELVWGNILRETGACVLRELRDIYGVNAFQSFFKMAHQSKFGVFNLNTGKKFFKDLVNPIVKEDALIKLTNKFPTITEIQVWSVMEYFFD